MERKRMKEFTLLIHIQHNERNHENTIKLIKNQIALDLMTTQNFNPDFFTFDIELEGEKKE